ncbi:SGNH hydrolase-type esterase domain-containing protein, partial [Cercophora newfieldiana]
LAPISRFKIRSHQTSLTSHLRILQSCAENPGTAPYVIFLGDSMLERFITTGNSANFTAPWPSPTLLPTLPAENNSSRIPRILNAGVGGDKIQNMAYRLLGSESEDSPLPSLAAAIANLKSVKVWVVHAGANNINPKRGLSDQDVAALEALLKAVLKIDGAPGIPTRLIMTGILYRKDVSDEKVDEANRKIKAVVERLNLEVGGMLSDKRVTWLGSENAKSLRKEEHLEDHVHLNLEGYRVWVREALFPEVVRV